MMRAENVNSFDWSLSYPILCELTFLTLQNINDNEPSVKRTVEIHTVGTQEDSLTESNIDTEEELSNGEEENAAPSPKKRKTDNSIPKRTVNFINHNTFRVGGIDIWCVIDRDKEVYFGTRGVMSIIYGKKTAYSPAVIVTNMLKHAVGLEKVMYYTVPPNGTTAALIVSSQQAIYLLDKYLVKNKYEENSANMNVLKEKVYEILKSVGQPTRPRRPITDAEDESYEPQVAKKAKKQKKDSKSSSMRDMILLHDTSILEFKDGKIWYGLDEQNKIHFNAFGILEVIYGKPKTPTTILPPLLQHCPDQRVVFSTSYIRPGMLVMLLSEIQTRYVLEHYLKKFRGTPNYDRIVLLKNTIQKIIGTAPVPTDLKPQASPPTEHKANPSPPTNFKAQPSPPSPEEQEYINIADFKNDDDEMESSPKIVTAKPFSVTSFNIGELVLVDWRDIDSNIHKGKIVGIPRDVPSSYLVEFSGSLYCIKQERLVKVV